MINRIKKFLYITFENITITFIVSANFSCHIFNCDHSFVVTFIRTARKRIRNKCGFKNWIQDLKDSVMQNPIPNCGFMNMTQFWVTNTKTMIRTMSILF